MAARRPVTDAALREIAEAYGSGMSIRAVAAAKGYSYGATHARLHQAHAAGLVSLRPRGHAVNPR